MDGLSGAASVVAILQLLESVVKLIEFGRSVRNAPKNVEALFNDLELLSAVLAQTEKTVSKSNIKLDDVTKKVIDDCWGRVNIFSTKIHSATSQLNSESFRRRTWAAFKSSLQANEISSLRRSVAEAKSTLNIILQNSILNSTSSILENQGYAFAQFQQFSQTFKLLPSTTVPNSNVMQLLAPDLESPNPHSLQTIIPATATIKTSELGNATSSCTELATNSKCETLTQMNIPQVSTKQKRTRLSSWERRLATPFAQVATRSITWEVSESKDQETKRVQTELRSILYPSRGARFLGMSYGLLLTARSTVGWQYVIEPFRAVPENALIFDFCKSGNVDAVRLLLQRGEASPMDRDPMGRTPLWIAARSLKVDVADLLLQEGADPHTQDWKMEREPIESIVDSDGSEMKPKLAMINLLQKRRRGDNEDALLSMLGLFFRSYRPQKFIDMSRDKRCAEISAVLQATMHTVEGDLNRIDLIEPCIAFHFHGDILQYLLNGIKGQIVESSSQFYWSASILHEAIVKRLLERDPKSIKIIMRKTKDLHLLCENRISKPTPPRSPTMLTMYDPNLFTIWRAALRELNIDLHDFITAELERGPLRTAGWDELSLSYLFEVDLTANLYQGIRIFGFPRCERCGHSDMGYDLKVDLCWRKYLKSIRKGFSNMPSAAEDQDTPEHLSIVVKFGRDDAPHEARKGHHAKLNENASETPPKPLPYRIVCSTTCTDGVCVAWLYENDSVDEPSFPPYPKDANDKDFKDTVEAAEGHDVSSFMRVPGAFVD